MIANVVMLMDTANCTRLKFNTRDSDFRPVDLAERSHTWIRTVLGARG